MGITSPCSRIQNYEVVGSSNDQGNAVLEMKSNGTILSTNVFAPDGLVSRLFWLTTSGGGTASCWGDYLFDWQGNAVHCLFSGGNLIEDGEPLVHAAYNAWGQRNFVYKNGAWPDLLRFGYNARWGYKLDTETGLYYCQHRYYDPANGRWVTRDPIDVWGGVNVYAYCGSNGITWQDKWGLASRMAVGGVGNWMYAHQWLELDNGDTYGFWPNFDSYTFCRPYAVDGQLESPDPHAGDENRRKLESDNSMSFDGALRECIAEWQARYGPNGEGGSSWGVGFACGSWADEMWQCARNKLGMNRTGELGSTAAQGSLAPPIFLPGRTSPVYE